MILAELAYIFMGSVVEKKYLSTTPSRFLYLTPANFITDKIISESEGSLYFSEKEYKRQSSNLVKIEYGDYLIYKRENNYQIIRFSQNIDKSIIPNQEFVVLRSENSFLYHFLDDKKGKEIIENEIKEISKRYPNPKFRLEKIKNIDIPLEISLEVEAANEDAISPFDKMVEMDKINIIQKAMPLDKLLKRIDNSELMLDGYFQRKKGLWDNDTKSRLIESMIAKLPIPAFYFDGSDDDKWLVVDGLQRLSAAKEFVLDKTLKLTGLDYYSSTLKDKTFDELTRPQQRRIEEYEIIAYIIQAGTPKNVKYKLFRSINTSALILSKQEIRHAINPENPSNYIAKLSENPIFKQYITSKLPTSEVERMLDREIALRYIAFRLTYYTDYKPSVVDFLDTSMTSIYKCFQNKLDIFEKDLMDTLHIIHNIFGDNAYTRNIFEQGRKFGFYNVLFEMWTFAIADVLPLNAKERQDISNKLIAQKTLIQQKTQELWKDATFRTSVIDTPYTMESVKTRFSTVEQLIKNILK